MVEEMRGREALYELGENCCLAKKESIIQKNI